MDGKEAYLGSDNRQYDIVFIAGPKVNVIGPSELLFVAVEVRISVSAR